MPNPLTDTLTSAATSFTSGVSALPGGFGTISNVVDNAKGAINSIPGAGAVSGLISSVTGALGSVTGALGSVTGALGSAGSILSKAASGLSGVSLSSLTEAGLPAGAAAQMNSAIAAISSGGSVPIKMPTVATGTFDRGEMSSLMASLGSPKIPMFSASGNPATFGKTLSDEDIKKYEANKAEIAQTYDDLLTQNIATRNAQGDYEKAKNELPQGDPQIDSLKATFLAETAKVAALEKKLTTLRSQ